MRACLLMFITNCCSILWQSKAILFFVAVFTDYSCIHCNVSNSQLFHIYENNSIRQSCPNSCASCHRCQSMCVVCLSSPETVNYSSMFCSSLTVLSLCSAVLMLLSITGRVPFIQAVAVIWKRKV